MSRGSGKTQRAILHWIDDHPNDAVTTPELKRLIYPAATDDLDADERSLRFAVTRSLKSLSLPPGWFVWKSHPRASVLFNAASARSCAIKNILVAGGDRESALSNVATTTADSGCAPTHDLDELRRVADGNIVSDELLRLYRMRSSTNLFEGDRRWLRRRSTRTASSIRLRTN